jgi:serine/threonine-protein kinase RsbW
VSDASANSPQTDRAASGSGPTSGGTVELTIPVESDLLVLARLAVSTVAARSEFDIEEIDDLRLAIDELCLSVLDGRRTGRLHLRIDGSPDRVEVLCHYDGTDVAPVRDDADDSTGELSGRILDALVDEHGPVVRDGWRGARLSKRRTVRDG